MQKNFWFLVAESVTDQDGQQSRHDTGGAWGQGAGGVLHRFELLWQELCLHLVFTGPLRVLTDSVKNNTQVLINCRWKSLYFNWSQWFSMKFSGTTRSFWEEWRRSTVTATWCWRGSKRCGPSCQRLERVIAPLNIRFVIVSEWIVILQTTVWSVESVFCKKIFVLKQNLQTYTRGPMWL